MKIETIENIKKDILSGSKIVRNFPKFVVSPFDNLYTEIVTQVSTIELSSECVLFDSVEAANTNKEYNDKDYWAEGYTLHEIANYWFFAQNGQGDLWLF